MTGGIEFAKMKACVLPQALNNAFYNVTSKLMGAKYVPVLYVGSQVVHGTNYYLLAEQTIMNATKTKHIVKMVINVNENGNSLVEIGNVF